MSPMRVRAFDSALQVQERIRKGLPPSSLDLLTLRSSHASGDYRSMVRDPVSNVMRTYSQMLPWETQNLNSIVSSTPSFISSVSHMAEGARLLLTQIGHNDLVIAVYENEPTSIISYALSSKEYNDSVSVKHLKGGKETKMDLMVMENLFFKRDISRVYDLKGSTRARYNSDTTGTYKVLLDMNLLETLRTKPKFLGSKAERILERAVWNDTSFLESVDVMDYSLLVGVDDERKELVLGIIDFMRQYTWDKHLDTWVKASGILDGPKNASPSIISSKQYKKRFRKAMTTYFLTVPDQWS
nr:putative 1-phosphatidylinositol-3-phosphate 5-kinase fab1c [Quercus suber]